MTHKLTITALVMDFKRKNEGQGLMATRALTTLLGLSLAYSAPLPNNGVTGAKEACRTVLTPHVNKITSDVNELMHLDFGTVQAVSDGVYQNRYEQAWSISSAINGYSVKQIIDEVMGDDIWPTVQLWLPRFTDAIQFYLTEQQGA